MESVNSAEELTKLLRAKTTSTTQIYDVVSQFDDLKIYFPHKEVFVFELIQDRWNDQRKDDFKLDYKIWELFNTMWTKIGDDNLLKKLFKNLKFVPLLLKSLQLNQDSTNSDRFLKTLLKTISLINSTSTVEVSFENSCKILAYTLNLTCLIKDQDCELSFEERDQLIMEMITLLDINNMTEITYKLSSIYLNDLLLATLKYINKYSSDFEIPSIVILRTFLGRFIFSDHIDSLKLLERFFMNNSEKLDAQSAILLFQISISFLSRSNFKQLEDVFTYVVKCQPKVTSTLLKELSASKKTLSQEFLETLFNNTMSDAEKDIETYNNTEFWSLLSHILDLDIEIGIKYSDNLMKLIEQHKDTHKSSTLQIWSQVIACHINAREYVQFISKWQSYCKNDLESDKAQKSCFLFDRAYTASIGDNIVSLSITQLRDLLGEMVDIITGENIEQTEFNKMVLRICLYGLPKLTHNTLSEIKSILTKVFEINSSTDLWEIKYLIMEVYDNIVPEEQLLSLSKETFTTLAKETGLSSDLFYYFFKLREYQEFDFMEVENRLMEYLSSINTEEISSILLKLFTNWSSIINSIFARENIKELIKILLKSEHINILKSLFINDDFFEEENIMYQLVDELNNLYTSEQAILYLNDIPIQCINKSARISLIENLSSKKEFSDLDISLLCKILQNPTFRSILESDFDKLKEFLAKDKKTNIVFTKIWGNHLSQIKESISQKFITNAIDNIQKNFDNATVADVYHQMSLEIVKNTPEESISQLKDSFTKECLKQLGKFNSISKDQLIWLLNALYELSKIITFDTIQVVTIENTLSKLIQDKESISNIILLETLFTLYCALYDDSLVYLYPQYLAIRSLGASHESILPALSDVLTRVKKDNVDDFNNGFIMTINSFSEITTDEYSSAILELFQLQLTHIEKENVIGSHLFVKSLSSFLTNLKNFTSSPKSIVSILKTIQSLEISKPSLFTQFAIETLFPLCLNINLLFIHKDNSNNDDIFSNTVKMISNVLLVHRVKLSNRNHLVISLLCHLLEVVSKSKEYNLKIESTKSLARLITNFCEPANVSNNQSNNKHKLSSKVGLIKQSLRKHAPMLLVKYVHLSINHPFEAQERKELLSSIHSIFNLLSQNELSLVNSILDNSGKQYFKSIYIEYKRTGKWRED